MLTYNKPVRTLDIHGTITCNTGQSIEITKEDIVNYSNEGTTGYEGLPLGAAEATSYNLVISNVDKRFSPAQFDNAEVRIEIGIINNDGVTTWSPFGVWYVDGSDAPEQDVTITLTGFDALASRFEAKFIDNGQYPTTLGSLATFVSAASGIALKSNAFPNAALPVQKKPNWNEETTLRDVLSYIAIAAGGFARITRDGQLEIVGYMDGVEYELSPDLYRQLSLTNGEKFHFNAIEAKLSSEAEEYSRFAIDTKIHPNATNTIQIDWNPLITQNIINSVVTELAGLEAVGASITWGGDPAVMCGDFYTVTDLRGNTHRIIVTMQSFAFDGGLSVTEDCVMPTINTQSSQTYSTSSNMYDANGRINATRLNGLDSSIITATTGHFQNLTSEQVETDKLLAAYLSAIDLLAGSIRANDVTTNILTSTIAKITKATINKINSGTIETDALYAALSEIYALKVSSLKAEDIETDSLAAALAKFTVITAGTATFDQTTIQRLVAEAMTLEFGVGNQLYIKNLAVDYAQMVNATVGNLVIKASDGGYYQLDVDAFGNVVSTLVTVTEGEATAGQTESGRVILETSITASTLNTSNLLATYALISKIDAARINVDELFAREAFVHKLTTSKIFTDGGTLDIVAQVANEIERWFKFQNDRGLIIRKPEYVDADGVFHPASIWYTVTDEIGYHIYSTKHVDPVGSFQRGGLKTTGVQMGDIVCKKTSSGGWVWTDPI